MTAGASFGDNGDIFEIRPCDQFGKALTEPMASIDKPLTSGETLYFNVRLIRNDNLDEASLWYVKYTGKNLEDVEAISNPLKIGIYVSGELRWAELHDCRVGQDDNRMFTDLIFRYKTRAGDVALPIVLAVGDEDDYRPASDTLEENVDYFLWGDNWSIVNDKGNTCKFWFWKAPDPTWSSVVSPDGTTPDGALRVQDYSLSQCDFYVQTIDFDSVWEEEGTLWRSVHQNSSITADGLAPKLTAVAPPENKITLYVWSTDDNAVKVKSNETIELKIDSAGNTKTTNVGTITFAAGQMSADFQIEGVKENETCFLVLSPWKNYNYSIATGDKIKDYVEVPVKCLEPLPPTVTVETDRTIAYANGDYMVYGAVMSVYLSEAYAKDMTVTITPTLADGTAAEMGDYIRFSTTETEVTALPPYEIPTVTIPANSTAKKQVYIFCLRGDVHTTGTSRMVFTPSVDDADAQAFLKNYMSAGMQIVAEKPVIVTPEENAEIFAICGDDTPINIVVEDTFADSSDVDTGYEILIKYRPTDLWTVLDGRYSVGEGGALYLIDENATGLDRKTTQLPVINYPTSGEAIQSQIKIKSPVSGKESEVRTFTANVKEARTSTVIETNDKEEFREGEQASLKITLSEPNDTGNTIYAFLKASDNITAGMLSGTPLFVICEDTDYSKTKGLAINKNNSETSVSKIKFLDGLGDDDDSGGLSAQFEVVLCTSQKYDETKVIRGYDSNYLNVTVYNEEPVIKRIEMNGNESESDGYVYPNKIPKGMKREFVAFVDDKGAYDKTTTVEGEKFQCKWTVKLNGANYMDPVTIEGNPADNPFEYDFPQAGRWTIRLQVKDKDMDDWADADYEVHLDVLDNPLVEITSQESFDETFNAGVIRVGLSYWDDRFTGTLKVKLTVREYTAGKTNYGYLKLDSALKSTEPGEDNVYYVDLNGSAPADIRIESMDGTENSALLGFMIEGEVVSTDTLPTSNESADKYYLRGERRVFVNNESPVYSIMPTPSTNRWVVAGGVDKTHPLNWSVRSDVENDFTGLWADGVNKGIKVSIFGPVNATEFYVEEATSGTFYPDFGDMQGDVDVTFLIEDKDGGSETFSFGYTVTPSKFLVTTSHGPGGGLKTSPLSRKYALNGKIGEGHTYVGSNVGTLSSAENFRLAWNCGKSTYAEIYAFGYKVDSPLDDGTLDGGKDVAISPTGGLPANPGDPCYSYSAAIEGYLDRRDSFHYCWLLHRQGDDSNVESSVLGSAFSPEVPGEPITPGTVSLPNEMTEDGNYLRTEVEAIFALEYYPEDNLGDINADRIPDVFAHKYWKGGNMIELQAGDILNNDLTGLTTFNLDEDSLPKVFDADILGGDRSNYNHAPVGRAFTAAYEIRGIHYGLNAVDMTKSEPAFCEFDHNGEPVLEGDGHLAYVNELLAWRAFKKAEWEAIPEPDPENPTKEPFDANIMPTREDLLVWSPEPRGVRGNQIENTLIARMDPTVEDTDGDGMPDGWEYYFWYLAHVTTKVIDSNDPRLSFERFTFNNVCQGIPIDADEVEARFNPLIPASFSNPDFDKDGLSDLEELAIGTNPCHWDTDGDGMCDGWEVMWDLDPMAPGDWSSNPDGDYMAYWEAIGVPGIPGVDENENEIYTIYPEVTPLDFNIETGALAIDKPNTLEVVISPLVDGDGNPLRYGSPTHSMKYNGIDITIWGRQMARVLNVTRVDLKAGNTDLEFTVPGFVFLHDQVRRIFGFDPRTAWNNQGGYVANRDNMNNGWASINTMPFTTYDEYLLIKYRMDFGIRFHSELNPLTEKDIWHRISIWGTNPNIIYNDPVVNDDTDNDDTDNDDDTGTDDQQTQTVPAGERTIKSHGADTDGDGVPDGWETYTFRNPNGKPGLDEDGIGEIGERDYDGDKLDYPSEYAGVDSCNAYAGCESIYKNHPGNTKGWFNKFFPTNPGFDEDPAFGDTPAAGADTDRDGIGDAQEGEVWGAEFYNAGNVYAELDLGFIYGSPADDNSLCIRGGGMNPCSVDTDADSIPDGWEMQHAGVPVNAATKMVVPPLNGGNVDGVEIDIGTFAADGILTMNSGVSSSNATANATGSTNATQGVSGVVYIAGGMDATFPGDIGTNFLDAEGGTSWDPLLGVTRDVDFDHDGLQNYQEYFIQAVRHFRYDDISTPLMGRLLTEKITVEVVEDEFGILHPVAAAAAHSQEFIGYVPFDSSMPTNFVDLASRAWGAAKLAKIEECVNYAKDPAAPLLREPWTVEGWRNLGYFAPAFFAWDPAAAVYMFPVTKSMALVSAPAGYVTTDPRMSDTDGDGMDDFYEMFHGLNPILGTNVNSPDSSLWTYGKHGDIISAVYDQAAGGFLRVHETFNAYYNEWVYSTYRGFDGRIGSPPCPSDPIKAPMAYDPVMYPWLQGTALVDSDGDGMRNDEERALANVADPMPRHTDPTPLWFTERTTPMSYVAQYYATPLAIFQMPWFNLKLADQFQSAAYGDIKVSQMYMYSFEEGEGYDTDGDFKYDGAEVVSTFARATDPQVFDDPSRRQALWLDGNNSYALSARLQYRMIYASDFLKQFTVECWVCPEKEGEAQVIVDRSVAYVGSALSSDAAAIRSNFRIGISADGKVYGMFDNSDAIESGSSPTKSCQFVYGRKLNANEWAHVALTFDGNELKLYIDGESDPAWTAKTQLIPANGVTQIVQHPTVGESIIRPTNYASEPAALFIGARPVKAADVKIEGMAAEELPKAALMAYAVDEDGNHYPESFDNVREFFGGYVDEVRIWDGARAAEDIKADFRKRYDFETVAENRDEVMRMWVAGATRNNNDGMETLPAELLFHYNFTTLPGAVDPLAVAKAPAAFESQVVNVANGLKYIENADIDTTGLYDAETLRGAKLNGKDWSDIYAGWWFETKLRNTVYDDYTVIPWIKNTVMHLTPADGSALDTLLYTEMFGSGYTLAGMAELASYVFPNSAQPYSSFNIRMDDYQRLYQAERIVEQYGDGYEWLKGYREFSMRSRFLDTTDLVPLGGAYAKTCKKMWDGAPADAWELTGHDDDADGLPNSWEEYCRVNYSGNSDPIAGPIGFDTIVIRDGIEMTAGQAYKYDLALGWQPNAGFDEEYKATIDTDGDNMPDWWENLYGIIDSTDIDDDDGDGLSNWAEYLLSEVFDLKNADGTRVKFSPVDATSVSEFDLDYFFRIGELYAGEIFTDHDFMDDIQEDAWGKSYTSRYAWDADSDNDEDGWSNFAEARYNDFVKSITPPYISHVVGDSEIKDMPIPTLKLTLRYNGNQPLTGDDDDSNQGGNNQGNGAQVSGTLAPIVVQTFTGSELGKPDATFTVQPGEESENTTYIGAWGKKTVSGTLTPGYVNGTSLKIEFAEVDRNDRYSFFVGDLTTVDPATAAQWPMGYYISDYETYMELYSRYGSEYVVLQADEFGWHEFTESNVITVTQDEFGENGFICMHGERIGTINLKSGDYSIDLTPLQYQGVQGTNATQAVVSMSQMVLRFKYNAVVPALQNNRLELFLGETDRGFVKEGKNTIVAFYDLDGDGKYTPGEPMGTAVGVDVGWRQGKAEIELTDISPIITRMNFETGLSDRAQLFGTEECGDVSNSVGRLMVNEYERVRVVRSYTIKRTAGSDGAITEQMMGLPIKRVVFDKMMNKSQRAHIFEGDFLAKGDLDLDWEFLASEAINNKDVVNAKLDLTDIVYEVFFGDGVIPGVGVSPDPQQIAVFTTMFVRQYDSAPHRPAPEAISPGLTGIEVLSTRPVFKWKMPGNHNGYTAFKIEVRSGGSVVWQSGNGQPLPVPARNADGVYSFEADAYIGDQLKNFESYTWRVSMYNSKFRTDLWSNELSFMMSAPENGAGYASIPVAVKYFGPSNVAGASTFVVEAFTTPDFTGIPAARAIVSDVASVTASGVQHPTNAVLTGLATGKYFLRAYADLNKAGATARQRDPFESWGYACGRGKPGLGAFNPTEFELTDRNGFEKPIDIYIEDVDTNGNSLPDAWEYVKYGSLNSGTKDLDGNLLKTFGINKTLTDQLQNNVVSGTRVDAYNSYIMTAFASPAMTALALGYNPDDVTVGENGSIQVESKVESIEIKSVSFDANGNVVVEIDGELNTAEGNTSGLGFITVEGETKKTVTCRVLWKASLSDADWTVKAEKTIVVGNGAQTIDIDGLGSQSSGFFKVVVTE